MYYPLPPILHHFFFFGLEIICILKLLVGWKKFFHETSIFCIPYVSPSQEYSPFKNSTLSWKIIYKSFSHKSNKSQIV